MTGRTWARRCPICQRDFIAPSPSTIYCGATCSRCASRRRRALRVYERDGWVCWLCGDPTNRQAHGLEPDAPSLDHVIPRARGGTSAMRNLRCAHRCCNALKAAQIIPKADR